jgi:hypothetical protein
LKLHLKRLFEAQKGFTIIETVAIIAIFGVLAAAVLLNLAGPPKNVEAGQLPSETNPQNSISRSTNLKVVLEDLPVEDPSVDWQQAQTEADQAARKMELRVVQTAVDTMMIKEGLPAVIATNSTHDMTAFPSGSPLYPQYLRDETTGYNYTCDKTGQVKIAE